MGSGRDKLKDIQRYYESNQESQRFLRQQLEFLVTIQILRHYLPPSGKVLELGAGAGFYTLELAKQGYEVIANDLCESLVEINRSTIEANGLSSKVTFLTADARDIESHLNERFEAIILFGPLYHLEKSSERRSLIASARRLLKPGGIIFTAHLTRLGFVAHTLLTRPEIIIHPQTNLVDVWTHGFSSHHPRDGSFRGYWSTIQEIPDLLKAVDMEFIALHAQDPCLMGQEDTFNRLSENVKNQWASFLFQISGDAAAAVSARHVLAVGRKKDSNNEG